MLALEAAFRPERAAGVNVTIDLTLSGFRFHVVVRDGEARCLSGAAPAADARASTTTETLLAIGAGRLEIGDAVDSGELALQGSRHAFDELFRLFDLQPD